MKLIACVVALIAAAEGVPLDMLDPIARLGAVAVLGYLTVWQAMRGGPARDKLYTRALDKNTAAIIDLKTHCVAHRGD